MSDKHPSEPTFSHRVEDRIFRTLMRIALAMPYERRVPMMGWFVARLVAPLAGYRRRIRKNLALVMPDLPPSEVRRLERAVPDNVGRCFAEVYSGDEFIARAKVTPLVGPGVAALEAAKAEGRPAVLATGHFGNYDVARAALVANGYRLGGLYRPMSNKLFDVHYVAALARIGRPLFPRGKRGLADMIRFLRDGGMLGIVSDQHVHGGVLLNFFGRPAHCATSAAELALRYDAPLISIYGIRQPDGLNFVIRVEAPIPPSTPEEMTQAINDGLEALIREHMDQWLWIYRRWKR